jgi:hypothetical protein
MLVTAADLRSVSLIGRQQAHPDFQTFQAIASSVSLEVQKAFSWLRAGHTDA